MLMLGGIRWNALVMTMMEIAALSPLSWKHHEYSARSFLIPSGRHGVSRFVR